MSTTTLKKSPLFRFISFSVMVAFVGLLPVQPSYSQVTIVMPPIDQMIHVTNHFEPPQMVGLKINLKDPFSFGFVMDEGQNPMSDSVKKEEYNKIIKYFLVSLAMPNKDMWVNLSPYESNRIVPEVFGKTEMGRDLLAQDYLLKQFTSSLMYPEDGLGKKFWSKVYQEAQAQFGTTDINVNTFNKVWIVADHADVYQKGDTAFLVGSHLKVMLEQDYMAIAQNKEQFGDISAVPSDISDAKTQMASQLVRQIIIPAIEKEVNEGQSFAAVRQIYNAEIMATWFKKTLRESLLGQVFADKSKIAGQMASDPQAKEKIFQQYLRAYKIGLFNYIKEDATPDGQVIPRRYLSGGMKEIDQAMVTTLTPNQIIEPTPTQVKTQVEDLTRELSQAQTQGPEVYQTLLEGKLSNSAVLQSTPMDLARAIAQAPVSPDISNNFIARLATNLTLPNAAIPEREATVLDLTRQLSEAQAKGPEEFQGVLNNLFTSPSISSTPIAPAMARAITEMPQLSENTPTTAMLVNHLLIQPTVTQAQEVQVAGQKLRAAAVDNSLDMAQVSLAPAQAQQMFPTTPQESVNSFASIPTFQVVANEFATATQPNAQYMSLYNALLSEQPNLATQVGGQGNETAPSTISDMLATLADQNEVLKENLEKARQAVQSIATAHLAAQESFTKQLSSMIPENIVKPLAQLMANEMIRNNAANSLTLSIQRIQQSFMDQVKTATALVNPMYMPLYNNVLAGQPNLAQQVGQGNESSANAIRGIVAQMAESNEIPKENIPAAEQAFKAIGTAQFEGEKNATQQLSLMVPQGMLTPVNVVKPLVRQMASQVINQLAGNENTTNSFTSMSNFQQGVASEFATATQPNAQYMPLYNALLSKHSNLATQVGGQGNETAPSTISEMLAPLADNNEALKENLTKAQQAVQSIATAHLAAQESFTKQLSSMMLPESIVRPLAQQMANEMISNNTTNSLAMSMPRIQQDLIDNFKQQMLNINPYWPTVYAAHMAEPELSAAIKQGAPAVENYLQGLVDNKQIQIPADKISEAAQGIMAIGTMHTNAIQDTAKQLSSMLPQQQQQMAPSLAQAMVQAAIKQAASNVGGINLSNEHLTMNIKVDGAGMPLPPQYQDKALLNLNGLVSIIQSITPITQQNLPALYQLAK